LAGNPEILARVRKVGTNALILCAPVKAELWFGACKSQQVVENQISLNLFFNDLSSLDFDDSAAEHFGEIRAFLTSRGTPIGPYDMQIAAIARANDLILVTHNTREFLRVPGLKVEDWQM
jgi:tRNA(fMet)-specific endonuclease VapC